MSASNYFKPILKAAIGLVVIIILIIWMSGGFSEKVSPDASTEDPYKTKWDGPTAIVDSVSQSVYEQVVGSIQAVRRTAVSSKILAQVMKVTVSAGDMVKEGSLLIELDARDVQTRIEQVQQQAEASKATFERAQADFVRAEKLTASGNVSQSQLDSARAERDVNRAAWERSKRALDEIKVSLTYTQILSPVTGKVVERLVEPGDTVSPGQQLLHVYDPQTMRLEVPVRESLALSLKSESVDVSIDAINTTLTGHIDEIVPQAETGSRTLLLKVSLPHHAQLYPGMFGRLIIPVGERVRTLVPATAIEKIGQLEFAHVVDSEGALHQRMVRIGKPAKDNQVEVLSGLQPGEQVALIGRPT